MSDLRVLSPRLPLTVRARLRAERSVDGVCGWLCRYRRGTYVAEFLWRACRMW
jgi:hypothetical protein